MRDSNAPWNEYLEALSPAWEEVRNKEFEANRVIWGVLPDVTELRAAIKQAPRSNFLKSDYTRFAVQACFKDEEIEVLKAGNTFVLLDAATKWALYPVMKHFQQVVTAAIGCRWRVLNIRSWIAHSNAVGGPYEWHSDGMPKEMLKLMIYCDPMGEEHGGLEVDSGGGTTQKITGPAGTWVLLYNSILMHRGIPPKKERVAMEITLTPWVRFNLQPRSLGVNGKHPFYPLMNDMEGL